VKATSIVDGIQSQSDVEVEVVHLNLLGRAGREVAAAYGVRIVPATIVFDQSGNTLYRRNGFPETEIIRQRLSQ
jgi:thioredoxin-related protein